MRPFVEYAYAKVNLDLHVLSRRTDGYHEIASHVAFVDVGDILTVKPAKANTLEVVGRFRTDVPLDDSNIIWKAYHWLAQQVKLPPVHVRLEKKLPVAAGIGGGSANAAAILRGLLLSVKKQLSEAQIAGLATALGADVPVCFRGRPCRMGGIGEKISALTIELPAAMVLVNPLLPCSTAAVFSQLGLQAGQTFVGGSEVSRNDMTEAALKIQPVIADVLAALAQTGLVSRMMSGSGATCFGLAQSLNQAEIVARKLKALHPHWWVRAGRVLT